MNSNKAIRPDKMTMTKVGLLRNRHLHLPLASPSYQFCSNNIKITIPNAGERWQVPLTQTAVRNLSRHAPTFENA